MIKNHKLLIDQDCPMCNLYGRCFTKLGLVDSSTIAPYQTVKKEISSMVNMEKAKKEIALVDTQNGQNWYGIDALLKLTVPNLTLRKFLSSGIIYASLKMLYAFISYNRKVIFPTVIKANERDCSPPLNVFARWSYLIFVALFTALILSNFLVGFRAMIGLPALIVIELTICFIQIFWQGSVIQIIDREKTFEYLGNMSTVSMIGALFLIPPVLLSSILCYPIWVELGIFASVISIMLFEHIRRCRLLGISLWMTVSWLAFRGFVATLIGLSLYL